MSEKSDLLACFLFSVGLKMYLLDPTLAIDLQYLGVCLPIPVPGAPVDLHQSQGWCLHPNQVE